MGNTSGSIQWIEKAFDNLLVKSEDYKSRLYEICFDLDIPDTKAKGYCYCVHLDGNGKPRVQDLIEFAADRILEYAIPKKELEKAKQHLIDTGSNSKIMSLRRKATTLFTNLKTTGEGGELLLYVFIQDILKLPQLISKMSLKTSGQVHYHGVDGVHVKYDPIDDSLNLYWGEAKMYDKIGTAITNCFTSLSGFLLDPLSATSVPERDLQLISGNIAANVDNTNLEDLLVRYFDKDDNLSNKLTYKGVCFVGFDYTGYPDKPLTMKIEQLKAEINLNVKKWFSAVSKGIKNHNDLELYEIHVFLVPFPSVAAFRDGFLKEIGK